MTRASIKVLLSFSARGLKAARATLVGYGVSALQILLRKLMPYENAATIIVPD